MPLLQIHTANKDSQQWLTTVTTGLQAEVGGLQVQGQELHRDGVGWGGYYNCCRTYANNDANRSQTTEETDKKMKYKN